MYGFLVRGSILSLVGGITIRIGIRISSNNNKQIHMNILILLTVVFIIGTVISAVLWKYNENIYFIFILLLGLSLSFMFITGYKASIDIPIETKKIVTPSLEIEMKTPMQELFYRVEQLRFAKNPIDELMMIRLQMLEKEKKVIMNAWIDDRFPLDKEWAKRCAESYYNETFKTKEK
jgi:hypothetical protein